MAAMRTMRARPTRSRSVLRSAHVPAMAVRPKFALGPGRLGKSGRYMNREGLRSSPQYFSKYSRGLQAARTIPVLDD
jgi:hypothetical protein